MLVQGFGSPWHRTCRGVVDSQKLVTGFCNAAWEVAHGFLFVHALMRSTCGRLQKWSGRLPGDLLETSQASSESSQTRLTIWEPPSSCFHANFQEGKDRLTVECS